jgi:hypothetical protein
MRAPATERWQVNARYTGTDAATRDEINKRAGRHADFSAGASYGTSLERTVYSWFSTSKQDADDLAKRLEGLKEVTVQVELVHET